MPDAGSWRLETLWIATRAEAERDAARHEVVMARLETKAVSSA